MAFLQEDFDVRVGPNTLRVSRFTPEGRSVEKRVLSLHGAGAAVRQRTFYLADFLTTNGAQFVTFDFSGHGESSGTLEESSLRLRKEQALEVARVALDAKVDVLMGNSMGGFIAVELLASLDPESVVLLCPAMYDRRAFDVCFDSTFTTILRAPESFRNNDAAAKLQAYQGRVMLVIGENDKVIPSAVMEIYEEAAGRAAELRSLVIPNAPHVLHVWAAENPIEGAVLIDKIGHFIFGDSFQMS